MLCGKTRQHELNLKGLPDGTPAPLSDPVLESIFTLGGDTYRLYRMASFGLYRLEKENPREGAMQSNLYDLIMILSNGYTFKELLEVREEGAS